jgi:hypothetical protein
VSSTGLRAIALNGVGSSQELLASVASVLEADKPTVVLTRAAPLFAGASGGLAAVFRLHADGTVADEFWHPANETFRQELRGRFVDALKRTRETGGAVPGETAPGAERHLVWCRAWPGGSAPAVLAVCIAAPLSGVLANPSDTAALGELLRLVGGRFACVQDLARVRAEREQQERYFKTLDQQLRMLDRERQKFVAVVNQGDTYTVVVDASYTVHWTNTATADRLSGAGGPPSWIGKPLREVWRRIGLSGPDPGSERCPIARAFRENEVVHQEFQVTVAGEGRTLYLTALPVKGPDGRPDEVLVLIQDLSNLDTLRRSEARYRLLFERSSDAMLMVEPEAWKVVLANPEACRLIGLAELVGLPVQRLHDERDWPAAWQEYTRAFARERPPTSERVLRSASGGELVVNMSAARFDLDGAPVVLVEFQDVTEKRRLEAELRHSQKMEAIGRLAGGVAHDFNNLLAVIQGQSELIISRLDSEDRLRTTVESVRKAAVRGSLLTRQLLAFSRKDVHKTEVLDVRDVVAGIEAMLKSLVGAEIALEISLDERACRVEGDRGQIEQVVMNLAVNSRDAMPDGGHLWIKVARADVEGPSGEAGLPNTAARRVLLEVRDDGCGMDETTRNRLFEPYFTTKGQGRGTGLGLSSSYGIVNECGGTIDVVSARGAGTTFTIHFPRVYAKSSSGVQEVALRSDFPHGTETILVVEDEVDVREMAVEVLESLGYRVLQAGSGPAALEILAKSEPPIDLLLSDVIMPGMSGGDLVGRAQLVRPGLRVIYMSGYTAEDSTVKYGVAHSEASFLQKPFSLEALSRKVRDALDAAEAAG